MGLISRRRLSRLEKLVPSAVAKRKQMEWEWQRQAALAHATKLVTLILHGEPHIEEPLVIAWNRALDHLGLSGMPRGLPYPLRALPYRLRAVVAALPGDTESAKIARVLSSAPSWLLHFCMASLDCFVLGIELPKSSDPVPKYGRDGLRDMMRSWPDLPIGTIAAGGPIRGRDRFDRLSLEELSDLIKLLRSGEENWFWHDRRRYREIMTKVDE
jgi:hypothetical protein